uniref:Uncharacterized protein n=1 Tax=Rhizophora mucronata TaxID=61149 RepID=A0A2P2R4S6_RHIMU
MHDPSAQALARLFMLLEVIAPTSSATVFEYK